MRKAPPGEAGPKVLKQQQRRNNSTFVSLPQLSLAHSLRRLHHLRRDADAWRTDGAVGRPPQPSASGPRLGELSSSEVYFPS